MALLCAAAEDGAGCSEDSDTVVFHSGSYSNPIIYIRMRHMGAFLISDQLLTSLLPVSFQMTDK